MKSRNKSVTAEKNSTANTILILRNIKNLSMDWRRNARLYVEFQPRKPLHRRGVAVVEKAALSGVESGDCRHVQIVEREREHVEILGNPLPLDRLGNRPPSGRAILGRPAPRSCRVFRRCPKARDSRTARSCPRQTEPTIRSARPIRASIFGRKPAGKTGWSQPGLRRARHRCGRSNRRVGRAGSC